MKLLSTLICLVFASFSFAQDLTLNMSEISIGLDEYVDYTVVEITNNTSENIDLGLSLDPTCYTDGDNLKIQICIGEVCYAPVNVSTTWSSSGILVLAPGETSSEFKFDPFETATDVGSNWTCTFFDINAPDREVSLDVTVGSCESVSNTKNIEDNLSAAFPNPAADQITIEYDLRYLSPASLRVYNVLGEVQDAIQLGNQSGQIVLDLNQYEKGLYYYAFYKDGGSATRAKSFIRL